MLLLQLILRLEELVLETLYSCRLLLDDLVLQINFENEITLSPLTIILKVNDLLFVLFDGAYDFLLEVLRLQQLYLNRLVLQLDLLCSFLLLVKFGLVVSNVLGVLIFQSGNLMLLSLPFFQILGMKLLVPLLTISKFLSQMAHVPF